MLNWKRKAIGYYIANRDGKDVAVATRVRDTGEPLWQLTILDGTPYKTTRSGRVIDTFVTLKDLQFHYGRLTNGVAA